VQLALVFMQRDRRGTDLRIEMGKWPVDHWLFGPMWRRMRRNRNNNLCHVYGPGGIRAILSDRRAKAPNPYDPDNSRGGRVRGSRP
jgi:hypothetical protein